MKIYKFVLLLLIMPVLNLMLPALAFDAKDYGDFSSRSVIMSGQKKLLTQEEKDLLISKKLVLNVKCLIEQIKKNNNENVELLLKAGVNVNDNYMTEYPIYISARENNFVALKMLYDKGAKLDRGFNSELYEAIKNKNKEMAQFLLDRRANINYKDSVTDNTILYMALKNNMLDIARQLIEKGVRPDRKSILYIKNKKLLYLIQDEI